MKFAAFDLETAKLIPENATDLKQYMPLGISCAALVYGDRKDVAIWQGVPQLEKAACQKIVSELREAVNNGYTLLTWNGCGFDFSVLAQESGLTEECSDLALGHVDLMLQVTFTKGHFLGLDKALIGAGLGGKAKTLTLSDGTVLTSMSGAMAPHLWARGEYQAVLNYLRADVTQLLELVRVISTKKQIEWTSNSGRQQSVPVSRFLLAKECFGIPEPDVSWMDNPPSREQFVEWIPNWRQRVFGSPSPTDSASSVTGAWQYSQASGVETTMRSKPNIESGTAPLESEQASSTIALSLTHAELQLCELCLRHAWEAVGDSTLLDADMKLKSAAGKQNHDRPYDTWIFLTQDECIALDGALHLMMGDAEMAATYWKDLTPFGALVFMTRVGGVKLSDLSTEIPNMRGILGRLNQAEAASRQAEYDKQQREQAEAARRQAEQERQERVGLWIVFALIVLVLLAGIVSIILIVPAFVPNPSAVNPPPIVATPKPIATLTVPSATPPLAEPTIEATAPTPLAEVWYVVRRGDSLSTIAAAYNVTWQVIAEANHISNPRAIQIGQRLLIPGAPPSVSSTPKSPPPTPQQDDVDSQLAAARSALLAGNFAAAEQGYRDALLLTPWSVQAQLGLGHALAQQSKLAEAEATYKAVLTSEPLNAAAHANLGVIYYRMGDLAKAADEYYAAKRINPNDVLTYCNLANLRLKQNNLDEAEGLLLKARDLDPKLDVVYYELGLLYALKFQIADAIAAFEKFLQIDTGQNPQATEYAKSELKRLRGQ